ncbi:NAD(P)H-binding protein [Micromonospora echinospora]|uniref:NAD(P)H-binding protein n=1 Tax=Micromonospora echinospora TaxID=1877 RepID=UPI00366A6013
MSSELLAVTAATGALGRLAVAQLLRRVPPERVVAVVRNPGRAADLGVEVRHGDYDDPESLTRAFTGVTQLLFVSSPELAPARRVAQHRAVVDAAVRARVEGVVYTGFLPVTGLFEAHRSTEEALTASGLPCTLLRNPLYTEAFVDAAVGAKELVHATGGRGLNTATRADLAEAAAVALVDPGRRGRTYELTGPLWTYPQLARSLGVPARDGEVAGPMGWLHGLACAGMLETRTGDLRALLGREPVGVEAVVSTSTGRGTDRGQSTSVT